MDIPSTIAQQGLGWTLFIGALGVWGLREKMHADTIKGKDATILDISDKRVSDAKEARDVNSKNIENLRSFIEPMYVIVQNLQNIANNTHKNV